MFVEYSNSHNQVDCAHCGDQRARGPSGWALFAEFRTVATFCFELSGLSNVFPKKVAKQIQFELKT